MGLNGQAIYFLRNKIVVHNQNLKFARFNVLVNALFNALVAVLILSSRQVIATETAWQKSMTEGIRSLDNQSIGQAEKYFRQAVREIDLVPHKTEDKVKCLNALANALALENQPDAAEGTYKKSLAILEKTYGKSSIKILPALFALGSIYESGGDHEAAMQYYKRAIATNEKHYGPYCPPFAGNLPVSDQTQGSINKNKKNGYESAQLSILSKQAGLDASKVLQSLLPSYKKDLLTEDDSSDQDLISSFQTEVAKVSTNDIGSANISVSTNAANDIASGNIVVSPTNVKQSHIAKRSRRI